MRSYPTEPYELDDLKRLNAAPWMVEQLKLNPSYTCWGPTEDYMAGSGLRAPNWKSRGLRLDDLNVVPHFYFQLHRAAEECAACEQTGYAPEALKVHRGFYEPHGGDSRWAHKITIDEAQALVDDERVSLDGLSLTELTARINAANAPGVRWGKYSHDAINASILVAKRCERLGYTLRCPVCEGHGAVYTAPAAQLQLVLWVLHPRKGSSRGLLIENIEQDDLPSVYAFLRDAAAQNAARFAHVLNLP